MISSMGILVPYFEIRSSKSFLSASMFSCRSRILRSSACFDVIIAVLSLLLFYLLIALLKPQEGFGAAGHDGDAVKSPPAPSGLSWGKPGPITGILELLVRQVLLPPIQLLVQTNQAPQ